MTSVAPPRSPVAAVLRTAWGNLVLLLAALLFGSLGLLFAWIPPRGTATWWCARGWAFTVLWAAGVRLRVEREVALGARRSYVVMANHQSMFDIPALIATLPGQTRFLAKRELFKIPIFGWALWAGGFVPVERGDRSRSRGTLDAARDRLRRGLSLLIFPEETRSRDGRLLPFKSGGFLLAAKAGVPVVPVGISGTRLVQPKGRYTMTPGEVTLRYGAPIGVADEGARAKRAQVQAVRAEIARLAGTTVADPEPVPLAAAEPAAEPG